MIKLYNLFNYITLNLCGLHIIAIKDNTVLMKWENYDKLFKKYVCNVAKLDTFIHNKTKCDTLCLIDVKQKYNSIIEFGWAEELGVYSWGTK